MWLLVSVIIFKDLVLGFLRTLKGYFNYLNSVFDVAQRCSCISKKITKQVCGEGRTIWNIKEHNFIQSKIIHLCLICFSGSYKLLRKRNSRNELLWKREVGEIVQQIGCMPWTQLTQVRFPASHIMTQTLLGVIPECKSRSNSAYFWVWSKN